MSSSFAIEDPFRSPAMEGLRTRQKAALMFKDMGLGILRNGRQWGLLGLLFSGCECIVEGVRSIFPLYWA